MRSAASWAHPLTASASSHTAVGCPSRGRQPSGSAFGKPTFRYGSAQYIGIAMTVRRPNGTFLPGSAAAGRPKGTRNKLAGKVLEDIFAHWTEPSDNPAFCKGQAALEMLYRERPGDYLRLTASLLPTEFVLESAMADLDNDQIDELLMQLRQRVLEVRASE